MEYRKLSSFCGNTKYSKKSASDTLKSALELWNELFNTLYIGDTPIPNMNI